MGKGNKVPYYEERESARYMTVERPYPMNANMDIEEDRMAFAYWIASCIGRENFFAFFHKPKSPSMLIIEINRGLTNPKIILGRHRWSQILREPSEEEKKMSSRIFHCGFTTMRDVEKYGWKRIDLKDEWFISRQSVAKWHRINNVITYPYPPTEWCNPPYEDPTRERLCRPLPAKYFPPPPPVRPPPVGSPEWQKAKEAQARGHTKGAPVEEEYYPTSAVHIPRKMARWAQDRSSPPGQGTLPPGLVPPPGPTTAPTSRWGTGPPGLVRDLGGASSRSSGSDSGTSNPSMPQDDTVRSLSTSAMADDEDDESDDDDDVEFVGVPTVTNVMQFMPEEPKPVETTPAEEDTEWVAPDWMKPMKKAEAPAFKCPMHLNNRCKPAICEEHAIWARQQKRAKSEQERKANKGRNGKESAGNWRGNPDTNRGRNRAASASTGDRDDPPHLRHKDDSGSSASSDERSASASSERSSPVRTKTPRNKKFQERAKPSPLPKQPRPAHLIRGAPSAVKSKPASASAAEATGGDDGNTTASAPTTPSVVPRMPASLRKQQQKGSANTPGVGSAGSPAAARPPPPGLRKGGSNSSAATTPATPPPPEQDTPSGSVDEWQNSVAGGAAPSVRGADDDARSVSGWTTASLGIDQWGSAGVGSSMDRVAAWASGTSAVRGVGGSARPAVVAAPVGKGQRGRTGVDKVKNTVPAPPFSNGAADDAKSVTGWSTASLGLDQWGGTGADKVKDAVPAWGRGPPSANGAADDAKSVTGWSTASLGLDQWGGNGADKGKARVAAWGRETPNVRSADEDARSVTGWSTASLGEDQWGSAGVDKGKSSVEKGKNSANKSKTSVDKGKTSVDKNKTSVDKNKSNANKNQSSADKTQSGVAAWGEGRPSEHDAEDDARSVTGWSTASLGEDQWGSAAMGNDDDDDDAVSVASTVGPTKPKKQAAAGAGDAANAKEKGRGKGKGKNKKNKGKDKNAAQAQARARAQASGKNVAAHVPAVAATPPAESGSATTTTTTTMSWADEMDAEDGGRAVAPGQQ